MTTRRNEGDTSTSTIPSLSTAVSNLRTTLVNEKVQHISKDQLPDWMMKERTRILYQAVMNNNHKQVIVYWMQRDVRTTDNWAWLLAVHYATQAAAQQSSVASTVGTTELHVVYALPPPPPPPPQNTFQMQMIV